jgi:DNA-binding FadR family transcriptional regulator
MEELSLTDSVAAQLADRINLGHILPGQRLASERALALEFGISRPVLREALQALQAVGIVEARQKSGWYVTGHMETSARTLSRWMQLQSATDIIMLRRVLEPEAIRAIPAVRVTELAKECADIAARMRRAVSEGQFDLATELHSTFHLALIQYTPSPLVRTLLTSMIEAVTTAQQHIFETPQAKVRSLERHDLIVAALLDGDIETVARRGEAHLEPVFTFPTGNLSR